MGGVLALGGASRGWARQSLGAAQIGLIGVPIGLAIFVLFCLANYLSLGRDLPAARAQVQAAYANGALSDEDFLAADTQRGWHQFNDCLILWQAIDQRASPAELTVTPLSDWHRTDSSRCARLRAFAGGAPPAETYFYHRYLHGHTTIARFLLPSLSVEQIRLLYHLILTMLILGGIGTGLWGLARQQHIAESLFWLIAFFAFARWFGLESFGQSLGHAPADIIHIGFLLFLAVHGVCGGMKRRTAILSAAVFGALVMTFEFLTGGIPLGLAAIIGGLPFALKAEERRDLLPVLLASLAAFCTAVLSCYLAKLALALALFGPQSFIDTALQLQMRAGLGGRAGEAVDLLTAAKKLLKGFQGLAAGMGPMAFGMVALATAAGLWSAGRLIRSSDADLRQRAAAILLSNLAIVAMLALLWQHTIVHAWFMHRTFAWTIASGFALFLLAALPLAAPDDRSAT